ncbi:uncharacterized protein TNCV_3239771 [Trichonephila clavipes]|nr:uncharacterized protein TNCV_3239771 [Trichonephila clavipes]
MPPRRNKEKFQQLTEFERGKIIGFREGGFSYHAIAVRVQGNSSIVLRVWKRRTDEHRTARKSDSGRRKGMSACDDRHLLRIVVYEGSNSRQTIDDGVCNGLMSTEPGKLIGSKLSFQMKHSSICGTEMVAFMLDAMPVNAAFQSALSNVIVH